MTIKETYKKEIIPKMMEKFGYTNKLQTPKVLKATINVGFGRNFKDKEFVKNVEQTLIKISGQKPVFTEAKKSISSFKIREGNVIGAKVTLRGKRMYDFIEKLVKVTFPRVRDFRGIKTKSVDRNGNITIGFKEHIAFPEIKADQVDKLHGLEVCISSTAATKEEGVELFTQFGFPFEKNN